MATVDQLRVWYSWIVQALADPRYPLQMEDSVAAIQQQLTDAELSELALGPRVALVIAGCVAIRMGKNELAIELLTDAVERNSRVARILLGNLLFVRQGPNKSLGLSVTLLERGIAAGVECPFSCFALGMLHLNGTGVRRDLRVAAEWLERAAMAEYVEAQCELGILLLTEFGNLNGAHRWLCRSAKAGAATSHYVLSDMYGGAWDWPADTSRAFEHLTAAAELGHEGARELMERMRLGKFVWAADSPSKRRGTLLGTKAAKRAFRALVSALFRRQ